MKFAIWTALIVGLSIGLWTGMLVQKYYPNGVVFTARPMSEVKP